MREEVIIIPKENKYVSYNVLNGNHSDYLKKYIIENAIAIKDYEDITISGMLATMLSNIGISVIIIESKRMYIYLPEEITKNQYDWFKGMYGYLNKYNIKFSYIENGEIIYYETEDEESQIKEFYKYIKKNIKKNKDSEENEYRRNI